MYLTNFGYDVSHFRNTAWKNVPWNNLEYVIRPKFVNEYKVKLFELLKSKV
jgi:hypothetical protein